MASDTWGIRNRSFQSKDGTASSAICFLAHGRLGHRVRRGTRRTQDIDPCPRLLVRGLGSACLWRLFRGFENASRQGINVHVVDRISPDCFLRPGLLRKTQDLLTVRALAAPSRQLLCDLKRLAAMHALETNLRLGIKLVGESRCMLSPRMLCSLCLLRFAASQPPHGLI